MIKNQAIGGRSNKALIFIGLFLALVSAVLVVVYLSRANDGGGDVSGSVVTPVVVATGDISAGTLISEEMVTVKPLASDAVLVGAYGATTDVVGQVTRVPLVAGEQVIPTKVTATGAAIANVEDPHLSYVVPDGKRAVSITVNSVIGASGLIRPGDYVDVILTAKIEGTDTAPSGIVLEGGKDEVARTILQNAQVLTIDQQVTRTVVSEDGDDGILVSESSDANPDAATVTLAVSPVHGEVLTVAETCGKNFSGRLALALRSFGDSEQVGTRTTWAEDGGPPTCTAMLGLSFLQ